MRYLNTDQVKTFYNNWGIKQDDPGPYESLALDEICAQGHWQDATSVAELGPGTGKFARKLFAELLPEHCQYTGIDLSETMLKLTGERLAPYAERVRLLPSNGGVPEFEFEQYDRIVANFVLDIFSPAEIEKFLLSAHQGLKPNGLLCLSNLSFGRSWRNKLAILIWRVVYSINPAWVGGCRPLALANKIDTAHWQLLCEKITEPRWGIPSEILVLKRI